MSEPIEKPEDTEEDAERWDGMSRLQKVKSENGEHLRDPVTGCTFTSRSEFSYYMGER